MDVTTRPMAYDDIDGAATVVEVSEADELVRAGHETPVRTDARRAGFRRHLRRFLDLDAAGAWVAMHEDEVVGMGTSIRRDTFWGLSLLFVLPDWQGRGIGRRLLDHTLAYADGSQMRMITTSQDARALRRYALAGLRIHPAVMAAGRVDRTAIPNDLPGREGSLDDLDLVADIDRRIWRDRTPDVEATMREADGRLEIVEQGKRRGYAVHRFNGVVFLGATDDETAAAVLWRALAQFDGAADFEGLTAAQDWAVKVALAARLTVSPCGPVFADGMDQLPGPWIPSGWYF